MAFFETNDGVKLFYVDKGKGQPIVLVHGWSGDHTTFAEPIESLSNNFRVVAYDLRGHGQSDRTDQGLTLRRFARDLKELMQHLDLSEVTLAGHSMGASTGFEYIRNHGTDRLRTFTILDMTPKLINDEGWNLGLWHGEYTRSDADRDLTQMYEEFEGFSRTFMKRTVPYLNATELEKTLKLSAANSPHVLAAMWHAMVTADYRDMLADITVPAQIAYGEKSTLYSKETADYLNERIADSTVIAFENCTHMLTAENPGRVEEVIRQAAGTPATKA
ncbi:alpha/beta fold hydrolase [Bhargavaea beijingensis]|uniref:Alpha/beta hydrolase n=1 Tax=Bhargavaea beijingensis TaxID=426756 RepID=A0ABX9Z9Q7_9BACL|nr:alpha/beta hydrolase [Bhargavaea beijingensis]RSK24796.1 alpha/beta hydrolase [Bhargavaea beijingensis]